MDAVKSHKDMIVWQKAVSLAGKVYAATRGMPSEEMYGLARQMRRAAISVASNIAEGAARRSRAEYVQFLHIARGSLAEIETQVMIAIDQRLILSDGSLLENIAEVGRLLNGVIRALTSAPQLAHARACKPATARVYEKASAGTRTR